MPKSILNSFSFNVGGNTITNHTAAVIPLTIKGAASQSANLLEIRNSSNTLLSYTLSNGDWVMPNLFNSYAGVGTGYSDYQGGATSLYVRPTATNRSGAVIKGLASQTADLLQMQDSSSVILAKIDSVGAFTTNSANGYSIAGAATFRSLNSGQTMLLTAGGSVSTNPHVVIRQSSSQTGDLTQWQTSTPTTVASISATGAFTASGDVSTGGKLQSTASAGDEGGEIFLNKSATNTTLTGGVTIDVWQNRLRFFEQGGDARGFYIDISTGGNGVSTNLVSGGSASNSFATISTPSGTSPVADSSTDTLSLTAGTGITITGDATADSIAIATNATASNTVSTIVLRDGSGNFAAGAITGTSFNSITGLSSTTPNASGTAAVGTATTAARADHVHPTTGLGLTSGTLAQFAATTSSQLAGVISDETGSGALVFGTSPTITSPSVATSLTTASASFDLINGNAATVNFAGAATTLTVGATTGTLSLRNPTITTSVTSGTLALFNTGLTGTLNIGGATGTINIGNSTTTKTVNIATATTVGNSSTVRIGTNEGSGTTSNIFLQGQIYAGKTVNTTGTASGTNTSIFGPSATATGSSGNAVGGNLTILSGDASIVDEFNLSGTATTGNLILDVGTAITQGGGTTAGSISIGTTRTSAVNIGRSGITTNVTGTISQTGNFTTTGSLTRSALNGGGTTGATLNNAGDLIRTTSSERYKQDIRDASYTYDDILSLQPKIFRLKDEVAENENAREYAGFIAEELDQIEGLKVFVNYQTQEDGSKIPDGINYAEMVSALVSAIKHQNSRIETLEATIEDLRS